MQMLRFDSIRMTTDSMCDVAEELMTLEYQEIYVSAYTVRPVMDINMMIYWGTRNAERCSAEPVGEYTCVRYT